MLDVNLAVSLHRGERRGADTLVPINRKWPIAELLAACAAYPGARNSRRIVRIRHAEGRQRQRRRRPRAGPFAGADPRQGESGSRSTRWPGAPYECSSNNRIHRSAEIVNAGGLSALAAHAARPRYSGLRGQLIASLRGRREKVGGLAVCS